MGYPPLHSSSRAHGRRRRRPDLPSSYTMPLPLLFSSNSLPYALKMIHMTRREEKVRRLWPIYRSKKG
uniref:Predicted protein n=1 Tax=Hordeum vulgare subsp. vulgare TaxID=112509 RepID=F2D912_HORVV|nr:predicted protein [Hordeum vulgare subsp. vulgare]